MVVNTDQGEQVTLEVDTHTMAPRDLHPGMIVRADFRALEDCRLYASVVTPLRGSASTERMQAYANTRDTPEVVARNATAEGARRGHQSMHMATTGARVTSTQTMSQPSSGMVMKATPTTNDYVHSTRPMVSGRVVTVNDHRLVLRTEQGQRVGMVMDSQTMLSRAVEPGTFVRTEFARLKDGRYYAKIVDLVGSRVAEREQAYAHTIDSDNLLAQDVEDCGPVFPRSDGAMTYAAPARGLSSASEPLATRSNAGPDAERPETLPQTASGQPLLLLFGALSLAAGAAVKFVRGFRNA
jgi:LPXTG-motif cell wall-anchored protein